MSLLERARVAKACRDREQEARWVQAEAKERPLAVRHIKKVLGEDVSERLSVTRRGARCVFRFELDKLSFAYQRAWDGVDQPVLSLLLGFAEVEIHSLADLAEALDHYNVRAADLG